RTEGNVQLVNAPADLSDGGNEGVQGLGTGMTWGISNYAANWRVFGTGGVRLPDGVRDGVSKTVFFAEKYGVCNHTANNQRWPGGSLWAWRPGFGVNGTQAVQDPDPTEFVHNYAAIFTNGNCVSLPGNPHHSL